MTEDKKTFGLTPANKDILRRLLEKNWFSTELDAALFAMSFAISRGIDPYPVEGTDTKWNVGSLDHDARSIIKALYPDTETPIRLIEVQMNRGLELLEKEMLGKGDSVVREALADYAVES